MKRWSHTYTGVVISVRRASNRYKFSKACMSLYFYVDLLKDEGTDFEIL